MSNETVFNLGDEILEFVKVPEGSFIYGYEYDWGPEASNLFFFTIILVIILGLIFYNRIKQSLSWKQFRLLELLIIPVILLLVISIINQARSISESIADARNANNYSAINDSPHYVDIKGFMMSKKEISYRLWCEVLGRTCNYWSQKNASQSKVSVSCTFVDALEFCEKLQTKIGGRVRLPKRVEWEYACRGGNNDLYLGFKGRIHEIANVGPRKPMQESGLLKPNNYGLYDMLGNVKEWCSDAYIDSYCHISGKFMYSKVGYIQSLDIFASKYEHFREKLLIITCGGNSDQLPIAVNYRLSKLHDLDSYYGIGFRVIWEP